MKKKQEVLRIIKALFDDGSDMIARADIVSACDGIASARYTHMVILRLIREGVITRIERGLYSHAFNYDTPNPFGKLPVPDVTYRAIRTFDMADIILMRACNQSGRISASQIKAIALDHGLSHSTAYKALNYLKKRRMITRLYRGEYAVTEYAIEEYRRGNSPLAIPF